jgi:hypothetical protein
MSPTFLIIKESEIGSTVGKMLENANNSSVYLVVNGSQRLDNKIGILPTEDVLGCLVQSSVHVVFRQICGMGMPWPRGGRGGGFAKLG